MKKRWLSILIPLALLALPFSLHLFEGLEFGSSAPKFDYPVLTWKEMREWTSPDEDLPEKLKQLNGTNVKIPGYIVPLEDEAGEILEFILVPNPMACIHVPPPPANQIVFVRLKETFPYNSLYRAVWVMGKFSVSEQDHAYGSAWYQLEGEAVEPYRKAR